MKLTLLAASAMVAAGFWLPAQAAQPAAPAEAQAATPGIMDLTAHSERSIFAIKEIGHAASHRTGSSLLPR
jgi:hypothetical protein